MPVRWQTVQIPLASGIQNKTEERALEPPGLLRAVNAIFTEQGGIQKRPPFETVPNAPVGIRRLGTYKDELIAFDRNRLLTFNESFGEWQSPHLDEHVVTGRYLAPTLEEEWVDVESFEQVMTDMCVLPNGVVLRTWKRDGGATMLVAYDNETGAQIAIPTPQSTDHDEPRVVPVGTPSNNLGLYLAIDTSTSDLVVKFIDGDDAASLRADIEDPSFTTVRAGAISYDIEYETDGAMVHAWAVSASGAHVFVDEVVWDGGAASIAERLDISTINATRVALDVRPSIDRALVVWGNDTSVLEGVFDSSGSTWTTIGTDTVGSVEAQHRLDKLACAIAPTDTHGIVFWSRSLDQPMLLSNVEPRTSSLKVDISTGAGGSASAVFRQTLASRAFVYDENTGQSENLNVLVWTANAIRSAPNVNSDGRPFIQTTLVLWGIFDSDQDPEFHLVGRGEFGIATLGFDSQSWGQLPAVQRIGGEFRMLSTYRRRIGATGTIPDKEKGPREIRLRLDQDAARRGVEMGETLYLPGALMTSYSGSNLVETGFLFAPDIASVVVDGAGGLEIGTYSYTASLYQLGGRGEEDRSTRLAFLTADVIADNSEVDVTVRPVSATRRIEDLTATVDVWRTLKNPTSDSPYYLVSSRDPTSVDHVPNDNFQEILPAFEDGSSDEQASIRPIDPESTGRLEHVAPPASSIVVAGTDRLFVSGIGGRPHDVAYSHLRLAGEIASFNEVLSLRLPGEGGVITGLAVLNETLVVFKEFHIYTLPGAGLNNDGSGFNYGPPRRVSSDLGATSQDRIAVTPQGILFHSQKGWWLLDRSLTPKYIGGPVTDFDNEDFNSILVMEDEHQVRIMSSERYLVYDYLIDQWATWTIPLANLLLSDRGVHSVMWRGKHAQVHLDTGGDTAVSVESDFDTVTTQQLISLEVETAWIKMAGLQGFARARRLSILGEYRSPHKLRVQIWKNYEQDFFQEVVWNPDDPTPLSPGDPEQLRIRLRRQKMEALKVRIIDESLFSMSPPNGEGLKLTGLALEYGVKTGIMRLPLQQRE